MKAPDKVFFPNDINVLTILCLRMEQKDDVCYIRKDVVDDMLKTAEDHAYFAGKEKMREELLKWAYEDLDPAAYLQLKDKLNEM